MSRYHVDNRFAGTQQNLTTGYKTAVALTASNATLLRRGRCTSFMVGADGAPNATDCQIVYAIQRQTAAGTSTAATPNPVVPADAVSLQVASVNFTAEGTYTLPIESLSLNQRASQRWVAQDQDAMLLWPATNLAGFAFMALSPTYAAPVLISVDYEDL